MPDIITIDRTCELLSLAASGQFTIDAEFKAAMRRAVQIVHQAERLAAAVQVKEVPAAGN